METKLTALKAVAVAVAKDLSRLKTLVEELALSSSSVPYDIAQTS
eukprot:CAMPEP_0184680974 /NCGR_PEP_ID=MMETSP0312-20130426/3900_1 /TAXON_ID=31354 /ORGANISM="Compsopogon coeruleus, Strain SAG 36.94" /LENGTH=44 /DNA_ID= /DNA_START= /DNA_END= /DNA_ORIENTATION=